VRDLTGDDTPEILVGTTTPNNGVGANGTDDAHSYVIALNLQGQRLWQHALGEAGTTVDILMADVNGDRTAEAVTVCSKSPGSSDLEEITLWNGQQGAVLRLLKTRWSYGNMINADINRDGREEILLATRQGDVVALDESLNVVVQYNVGGIAQVQVHDFNQDGILEISCDRYDDSTVVVLDHLMKPMAKIKASTLKGSVRVDDAGAFSFLFERESGTYGLYDLAPAPVIGRFAAVMASPVRYVLVFVSGLVVMLTGLWLYDAHRKRRPSSPIPRHDPAVFAWATVAQALAHELKSPLNVLSITLRGMMAEDHAKQEQYGVMLEEIDRLRDRANAMMRFVECVHLKKQPLDLNRLLQERVAFYRQQVLPAEIVLTLDEHLPRVQADPKALSMVVDNLIDNAMAAMDGKGQVVITTTVRETLKIDEFIREAVMEIMDTGAGIPAAHLASVFEPAFTTKPSGTGFGLTIAQHLVEAHGGTIALKSQEHVGTIVIITLPVAGDQEKD
jgi:signal transduction histidine kinase